MVPTQSREKFLTLYVKQDCQELMIQNKISAGVPQVQLRPHVRSVYYQRILGIDSCSLRCWKVSSKKQTQWSYHYHPFLSLQEF